MCVYSLTRNSNYKETSKSQFSTCSSKSFGIIFLPTQRPKLEVNKTNFYCLPSNFSSGMSIFWRNVFFKVFNITQIIFFFFYYFVLGYTSFIGGECVAFSNDTNYTKKMNENNLKKKTFLKLKRLFSKYMLYILIKDFTLILSKNTISLHFELIGSVGYFVGQLYQHLFHYKPKVSSIYRNTVKVLL